MIDQCIFDVYQRDKKVFLPDFGAIIYTEFNDSIDFNDLLTFDDGKVVEEIQKQESLSEEEARNALEEYIQDIKDTLGKGKLHYIGGIGYLSKDENDNYFIEKSKPTTEDHSPKKSSSKAKTKSSKKKSESSDHQSTKPEVKKKEPKPPVDDDIPNPFDEKDTTEPEAFPQNDDALLSYIGDEKEIEKPIISGEETEYDIEEDNTFSSFSTDDNVYNEEELKEDENTERKNSSSKKVLWIAFFVIILSIGGFYLYRIFLAPQPNDDKELLVSNEEPKKEQITSKPISNSEQNDGSTETTSSFESGKEKLKALSNDSEATRFTEDSELIDDDEQKTFSLILGSFKVERNADKFRQRLQSRGINVEKFRGIKGYYFVGIEKIEGKSNAVRRLEEFKKNDPSAWIYNNALLL